MMMLIYTPSVYTHCAVYFYAILMIISGILGLVAILP